MSDAVKFIQPNWEAPSSIKAYTTLRFAWESLEIATSQHEKVLTKLLSLPSSPIWLKQIHGTTVIESSPHQLFSEADASFSQTRARVCAIATADCLPILICNQAGTLVAAIHAGWRGLAAGIIANTIQALKQPANKLLVWLGPAISVSRFEVGIDVYQAFTTIHPETARHLFPLNHTTWLCDLYGLARLMFNQLGIYNIYGGEYCTYNQAEWFYSYRRDQGKTGRMVSLIWINQ
jgi:YfiH family protein